MVTEVNIWRQIVLFIVKNKFNIINSQQPVFISKGVQNSVAAPLIEAQKRHIITIVEVFLTIETQ